MVGVTNKHLAIAMGGLVGLWSFLSTIGGFCFVDESGRRKLVLLSLCGVIVSLGLLGLVFCLASVDSPPAFAPAHLNTNDSSSDGDCRVYSNKCSKCFDCVMDDCNYILCFQWQL